MDDSEKRPGDREPAVSLFEEDASRWRRSRSIFGQFAGEDETGQEFGGKPTFLFPAVDDFFGRVRISPCQSYTDCQTIFDNLVVNS
jgi:hypothetical protein